MTAGPAPRPDRPEPSDRELDDLITRHLDAGLDPVAQRRLAALLAATPSARETLARYLRLEGALIRLASAGLVAPPLAPVAPPLVPVAPPLVPVAPPPRRLESFSRSSRWPWPTPFAGATAVLAVAVVAVLVLGPPRAAAPRGGDITAIAERWLELQVADAADPPHADVSGGFAATGAAGADLEPGEFEQTPGAPPAWLVAAVADEG